MSDFDELAPLDLRALVGVLASRTPKPAELEPGQWLGVVELVTMRLADGFDHLPAEHRGTCSAAFTYALEIAVASGAIDHRGSVIRRLNLALALLRKVRPNAELDILDPRRLIEIMLQELPMSAEEAQDLSADWRSLDVSQIRRLRAAKNLVSPGLALSRLVSGGELDPRLRAWADVVPSLP